jgi:SET domain-containing protein
MAPDDPNVVLGPRLIVKKSRIPGAGRGLFARKLIPSGSRIGYYNGVIVSRAESSMSGFDRTYLIEDLEGNLHDGRQMGNKMRWINDPRSRFLINCEFRMVDTKKIAVYAVRDIKEGEEILIDYGENYEWPKASSVIF